MDYLAKIKGLCKEFGKHIHYNFLNKNYKTVATIGMLPFFAATWVLIATFYALVFLFNCASSSVDYLTCWLKDMKKDVHPATEAILYFATIPTIFMLKVFLSFFAVVFFMLWFEIMIFTYLTSLGGIRFQPFVAEATYDDDIVLTSRANYTGAPVFAVIVCVLFAIVVVLWLIVHFYEPDTIDGFETLETLSNTRIIFMIIYYLFAIISQFFIFKKTVTHQLLETVDCDVAPTAVETSADVNDDTQNDDLDDLPDF